MDNVALANLAADLGLAAAYAVGLEINTFDLAVAAVEALTAAGVAAGLDPGVARDAAEKAVEEQNRLH